MCFSDLQELLEGVGVQGECEDACSARDDCMAYVFDNNRCNLHLELPTTDPDNSNLPCHMRVGAAQKFVSLYF